MRPVTVAVSVDPGQLVDTQGSACESLEISGTIVCPRDHKLTGGMRATRTSYGTEMNVRYTREAITRATPKDPYR